MGLGDFLEGVGHDIGSITGGVIDAGKNVVKAGAWGATHLDDAVRGVDDAISFGANYTADALKGVGWVASHPAYWDDAAKTMIVDQFTDPVNIATNVAMLGLTIATGGAAAPAWMAKLGLGAKAGIEAAEGVSTVAKVADTALDAAKVAKSASRMERFAAGAERVAGTLDKIQEAPSRFIQSARSGITGKLEDVTGGLIRQRELSYVQEGRQALATKAFGSADELKDATGLTGAAQRFGYRQIAGGATKSELTKAGSLGESMWRANRVSGQVTGVRDFNKNLTNTATAVQFAADPKKAGIRYAKEHKSEIAEFAGKHAKDQIVSTVKNKLFGDPNDKRTDDVVVEAPAAAPAASAWQRSDDTGMVAPRRSSSFVGGGGGSVTTTDTSAVGQVGPSNWYGQQGYGAGRGFQSPASQQQWGTSSWSQDPALA